MIIGVLKEIKNNENRVGLTPAGVSALAKKWSYGICRNKSGTW